MERQLYLGPPMIDPKAISDPSSFLLSCKNGRNAMDTVIIETMGRQRFKLRD